MKGAGASLVLQAASITPALRDAEGPLSIGQAAKLLNLSTVQIYNWTRHGLPVTRVHLGRGNDKIRIDAAELRAWLTEEKPTVTEEKPTVWVPKHEDDLACDPDEYQRRQAAGRAMLERWGA